MAKSTFTIDANHKHESKGDERTLAALFRAVAEMYQTEDGEPLHSPADVFALGCRTLIAKGEYHARVSKGQAPSRIYTARVFNVDKARKDAATIKDAARKALAKALGVKLPEPSEKPAKAAPKEKRDEKPAPKSKPVDPAARVAANNKRIKELEAAIAAKKSAKPVAAPLAMRKASASKAPPSPKAAKRSDVSVLDLLNNY